MKRSSKRFNTAPRVLASKALVSKALASIPTALRALAPALLLLASYGSVAAQTLGVALTYADGLKPEVQLRDLSAGRFGIDIRVAGGVYGPLEAGAVARFRSSFGPLGTVAATGRADLDASLGFDVGLSGSGALATTGFDGALELFNRNPGAFSPPSAYALSARPFFGPVALEGGVGAHLALGVTRRVTRTVLLEAKPALSYLSGAGLGGRLEGSLQFRRLVDNDNGAALLLAGLPPGGDAFAAAGFEYRANRTDLPPISAALLLGVRDGGVLPGLRASVSGGDETLNYRASLNAEPYRSDAPPYRGNFGLSTPVGGGAAGLELGVALPNRFGVPPLLLRGSFAREF